MQVEPKTKEVVVGIFRSFWSFGFVSNFEFRISKFLLAAALLIVPAPASAHLMNTGLGPFYDGVLHLFVTPEDLLPVMALTLLGGLRGARCGRAVLCALPLAWLAASVAGLLIAPQVTPPAVALAAVTIALGALVAADLALPLPLIAALALVLGSLHGAVNGMEMATLRSGSLGATCLGFVGVACALFVLVSLLAGHVASLRAQWARVVVRVAGSWITAIGLLMLGWAVRGA